MRWTVIVESSLSRLLSFFIMNLKVIAYSSDNYNGLALSFAKLFNMHWPNKEQKVDVLCFDIPSDADELPDNFSCVSVGKQSSYGRLWTDPLIKFLDITQIEQDTVVLLMMIDHFIVNPVSDVLYKYKELIQDKTIDKVFTGYWPHREGHKQFDDLCLEWTRENLSANWEMGAWIEPSMWRVELLRQFLVPGHSWRTTEKVGREAIAEIKPKVIFASNTENILINHIDASRNGHFNMDFINSWIPNSSLPIFIGYNTVYHGPPVSEEVYNYFVRAIEKFHH